MKTKIVFFGSGPYVDPILEILEREFDVVLIVSSKEKFEFQLINQLESSNAEVAILASFGQIIPNKVLDLFEFGIINIHPSLLPLYRGPTPVQTAILNGDSQTGVSIMKLDTEVDHGLILAQEEEKIEPTDTSESLYKKLFALGAQLIVRDLPKYISGELKLAEQDHSKATYTQHLTRKSGFIDLNNPPLANQIENMVRAYYPWPGVWFKYRSQITDHRSKLDQKIIKLLPEERIQVEGKSIMSFKDFANGYSEGKEILQKLNL